MQFDVLEEKENPFFGRKELRLELKHVAAATPAKQELVKELAAKYAVPEEYVAVDFIFTEKGSAKSVAKAKIYREKPKERPKIREKKAKEVNEKKEEKVETQANETK